LVSICHCSLWRWRIFLTLMMTRRRPAGHRQAACHPSWPGRPQGLAGRARTPSRAPAGPGDASAEPPQGRPIDTRSPAGRCVVKHRGLTLSPSMVLGIMKRTCPIRCARTRTHWPGNHVC
jgi:hypothetical protein